MSRCTVHGVLEPLQLRDQQVPDVIVVIRLGVKTLDDHRLAEACVRSHDRWGIWAFSVLEVPDGDDFGQLVRLRPEVGERRQVLIASGSDLVSDGFPPTAYVGLPALVGAVVGIDGGEVYSRAVAFPWSDLQSRLSRQPHSLG